jgi:lysophospholipase L1-like esterase
LYRAGSSAGARKDLDQTIFIGFAGTCGPKTPSEGMESLVKKLFTLVLITLATACSHPLEIVGEGDIVSLSKGNSCSLEDQPCANYVAGDYQVTYTAIPRPGWSFVKWENCGGQYPNCTFDVSGDTVNAHWGDESIPSLIAVFAKSLGPNMVVVGDSITALGGSSSQYNAYGYWVQGLARTGWKANLLNNGGQSGANLYEILNGGNGYAGIDQTVHPFNPDFVVLQGGVNQIRERSKEQLWDEYDALYQELKTHGYEVVPCTMWARQNWYSSSGIPIDTASIEKIQFMNRKIRQYPEPVCDLYNALMRVPDNGLGIDTHGPKENVFLNNDNVHPSDWGANLAGEELARVLRGRVVAAQSTIQYDSDGKDMASQQQMVKNPLMEGSQGSISDGTGIVADNWTITSATGSISVVASKETHPSGFGWYQVISFTATEKGERIRLWSERDMNLQMAPGQVIELEAEIVVKASQPGGRPSVEAGLHTTGNIAVHHRGNISGWQKPASNMPEIDYGPIVIKTMPQEVPNEIEAGMATVSWTMTAPAPGTYTVKIGRVSVRPTGY